MFFRFAWNIGNECKINFLRNDLIKIKLCSLHLASIVPSMTGDTRKLDLWIGELYEKEEDNDVNIKGMFSWDIF